MPIFGTQTHLFGTDMAQTKPKFMLIEHGRYFYQRKVPLEFQTAVGRKKWRAPLGDDFDTAYDRLKEIKSDHDTLLKRLKNPEERRDYRAAQRRKREGEVADQEAAEDAAYEKWCHVNGAKTEEDEHFEIHGEDDEPAWEKADRWIAAFDDERTKDMRPSQDEVDGVRNLLGRLARSDGDFNVDLPPHPEYKALVASAPDAAKSRISFAPFLPEKMDDDEYHDRLVDVHRRLFGDDVQPPSAPEDRDAFDFAKMGMERRIARVARNPDTLNKVAEKFFRFAQLRKKTEDKYRRTIERLVEKTGDIPVGQVTPRMLRDYRDHLKNKRCPLLPSSIRAEFTPIMGLFSYAVDEELIEISPMVSVKLPKERRAVEEMKWLPFDIDEVSRIFAALDDVWGQPVRGLSDERRDALRMAVRVLAHTAMRPAEFMALRPDQVDDRAIRVEGGKTKSSWRVIPLHPEIADFPAWLHAGGLTAFHNSKTGEAQTDTVTVLRHNFSRLVRSKMAQPINDRRKTLYSLRSTFQNAMRRAGAPKDVRRAILGHVESGAIRHYDDGPSFDLLRKWVEQADPRV